MRAAGDVVGRVLRHVYRSPVGGARWDGATLAALGVGAVARGVLLGMSVAPSLEIAERAPARDGTVRLLLRAGDGELVESVLIPTERRTTVCISSQVGCARACSFCETGKLGLQRQLQPEEIVDQVRLASREWAERSPSAPPVGNIVVMGMGEPFDNLPNVLRALGIITDDRALAFAPSRVTVSTVGVADKLAAFFAGTRAELAVSLNAPDDARRDTIMPVNRRVPLRALREALDATLPRGRRVLVEYVLFDGFNDALEDADLVAAWASGLSCRINVIPANPGPDAKLRAPSPERLDAFVARLASRGLTTLVRRARGRDVGGACGQLAGARRLAVVG